ncbi:MAG TPA: DNA polymerase III subunit gamma/tau [Firmicutes bacterium]|jgi:DNA polymerase-3 subunit gamma/tau|nr:DNA polymerase III subunit gamma/tau [Bacillota bacterium]
MAYTALYRKYRPSNFASVVGQEVVVDILKNSILNNKVSHAYLFTGPRGTGKTSIAKILAHAVNCLNFNGDICGECEVCKNLEINDSDIIEIDAASNNGVDEIRTLRDNVKLLPSFCKYKIYIIDEVHMLSTGAFNALLKTLEEPPSHVIFILATTEPNKIPLTILSRCQRFDFNKISNEKLVSRLLYIATQEGKIVDKSILEYIAEISDGGLRDAINLLDQVISLPQESVTLEEIDRLSGRISQNTLFELLNAISIGNYLSILNISDIIYGEGKNYKDIADGMLAIVRDLSINFEVDNYFNKDYSSKLATINIPFDKLISITSLLNELIKELKNSNDPKMLFDIYMVNICNSLSSKGNLSVKKEDINNSQTVELKNKEVINISNIKENKKKININKDSDEDTINEKTVNTSNDIINGDLKSIRINNVLAEADKNILNNIVKSYDKIGDYVSNKVYNTLSILLLDGHVVVASTKYLLFAFESEEDVTLFDNNYKQIELFIKEVFEETYKVAAVTKKEWQRIKEDFIKNKKNQIPYVFIDENDVKLDMGVSFNDLENSALDLFGEDTISVR